MAARVARAQLVGRTGEPGKLEEALAAAAEGGSTFLVAGEAGTGKARLVTELAERARSGGTTVPRRCRR